MLAAVGDLGAQPAQRLDGFEQLPVLVRKVSGAEAPFELLVG
jgi:hypothetical protein